MLFLFSGCQDTEDISLSGNWEFRIGLQNKELPVLLKIEEHASILTGVLYNGKEKIELTGKREGHSFKLEIGASYGLLKGQINKGKISGYWLRTHLKDYELPLKGEKVFKKELFSSYEKKENFLDISGRWRVQLDDQVSALGVFKQTGQRVQGSILTETGDYRFLDGHIEKDRLKLYGFDGGFAFVFELIFSADSFKGNLYWGKNYQKEIRGSNDAHFLLRDPTSLTSLKDKRPLSLSLRDLKGRVHNLDRPPYKGKAKVIQIFGSWCPNCIDETRYFVEWRKNNVEKLNHLEFVAVAFERFDRKQDALKALRKFKSKMNQDYPILVADFSSTKSVSKYFPIRKIKAFPTTLYLDRDNNVVKIYTGFYGEATGDFFEKFKQDFELTILKLLEKK